MPETQTAQLPHDIYAALFWTRPTWQYVAVALLAVAAAFVLWRLVRAWRRRPRHTPTTPSDPWDVLLARVAAATPPLEFPVGRPQEDYYFGLSLLLREAIEKRTRIPATDLTMQELREPLRHKLPLTPEETQAVLAFLERADLVKFAGRPSTREEAGEFQGRAVEWVRSLTPKSIDAAPTESSPWQREAKT